MNGEFWCYTCHRWKKQELLAKVDIRGRCICDACQEAKNSRAEEIRRRARALAAVQQYGDETRREEVAPER